MQTRTLMRLAQACALSLLFSALLPAQQKDLEGSWQMDAAKSKVTDGRVVTISVAGVAANGIKMTMKTAKKDGQEVDSEFTSKLDGKPCDFSEGTHKSQLTAWFNGPALNASKEAGPADDKVSAWKFELSPDKKTLTMTINHYDPSAEDEVLVFNKK